MSTLLSLRLVNARRMWTHLSGSNTADPSLLSGRLNCTQEAPCSQMLFTDGRRSLHTVCSSEFGGEQLKGFVEERGAFNISTVELTSE